MIIKKISYHILKWKVKNLFSKVKQPISSILSPAIQPFSYFIALLCIYNITFSLNLPIHVYHYIQTIIAFLLVLFLTIVVYRVINITANNITIFFSEHVYEINNRLIPFISNTLKILVLVIGVLLMLRTWGINIDSILAGISIGGVAVAWLPKILLKIFLVHS